MKTHKLVLFTVCGWAATCFAQPVLAQAHKVVEAKDGSGVFGYKDTPIQPWSGYHVHDPDRPVPPKVTPPPAAPDGVSAPSDALILFDGRGLEQWAPNQWRVEDGCLVATEGPMKTVKEFGDCQLHLEWAAPTEPEKSQWNRGNNGVFFLGDIEVQIFESFHTKIYPDGQAAAIYAQTPPLVNACREPGQWESYDIVFRAPRFDAAGKVSEPARLTMLHNGVLVHNNQEIYGNTPHCGIASYDAIPPQGPISFGAHHCPVRFRNIWIRSL
jgi:hypothetical protein